MTFASLSFEVYVRGILAMRKSTLTTTVLAAGLLVAGVQFAKANTVSIGYGIGAASPTLVASGSGFANVNDNTPIGSGFFLGAETSSAPSVGFISPNFTSTTLDASGSGGVLNVYITQSAIPAQGAYNASFAFSVASLSNATITESFYLDTADGVFTTPTLLQSQAFSGTGSGTAIQGLPSLASPYSITELYTITFHGEGNTSAGMTFTDIPEPASLAVIGTAVVGLGAAVRRRRAARG